MGVCARGIGAGAHRRGRRLSLLAHAASAATAHPRELVSRTLAEAAELLLAQGGYTGIQLDGGGSAVLVAARDGELRVVSSPSNFKLPGWERSVATHLGVRARPY